MPFFKISFAEGIILAAGVALAPLLPGYAHAEEVAHTVAVFQQEDGTPCKIVARGEEHVVYCHIRGQWQLRQTPRAQSKKPTASSHPVTRTARKSMVARAAQSAAFDFEFVEFMM